MTMEEMVEKVKGWITDRSRPTKESLKIAENIRDLCEEWVDALRADLTEAVNRRRGSEMVDDDDGFDHFYKCERA